MRHWAGKITESRFLRRLGLLSGGTIFGQGLIVLSSPLLTRLYSPEEFGFFAIFSALAAIMGVAIGLRYEFAIPVVKDDSDAVALVAATALCSLLMATIIALAILLWGREFAQLVGDEKRYPLLWILPPALLCWGIGSGLSFWAIRRDLFRLNGMNRVVQFGTQAGGQLALGLLAFGGAGLVVGYVLGYATRLIHFVLALAKVDGPRIMRPTIRHIWSVCREHWRYPVFSASSSVLQSICHMLPAVLVAMLYGPAMAGLFALSHRVVALPVRLFSDSASQVFLGEVSNVSRGRLIWLFKRTVLLFLVLGLAGMLPLLLAGPSLFALVFGEPWREAGVIVQILVPLHLTRFIVTPISQTLNVLQRQDLHLILALINGLALVVSFAAGWWWLLEARWTFAIFSLSSTAAFVLYIAIAWYQVRRMPDAAFMAAAQHGDER